MTTAQTNVQRLGDKNEQRTDYSHNTTLESGYFYGKLINALVAFKEAMELAKLIGCRYISLVSYEDLDIRNQITADDKVRLPNGKEQLVNSGEIRENTIKRYRPASNTDGCFCQMCRTVKSTEYIEVNNIWAQPKYYWPQMRISLCLDCSKRFEAMRSNKEIIEQFYRCIESADVQTSKPITIQIGNADIRFTQTHLAEIQAILKTDKK